MDSFVKAVFLGIMGTTVALLLYFIFFGFEGGNNFSFSNNTQSGHEILNESNSGWKGLLFYSAEAVEVPISSYYHTYCFNAVYNDYKYLDEALGYDVSSNTDSANNGIVTVTSLDGNTNSASNNSVSLLPAEGSKSTTSTSTYYYSTDWE